MKPKGLAWKYFIKKHHELWPLWAVVGIAMTGMNSFILWSLIKKDFVLVRGKFPWDKLDLLKHPYHRKLIRIHEEFDELTEMDCLYKDMDRKERELARKRKEEKCD